MAKSKTQNSNFTSYLHLVAIFLFLLVSLIWYHGSKDLYFLTGDQMYIGVMVLKDVNPQFFSKDTFFRDKQFYQYYIPTFRKLIRILYEKTGDIVVSGVKDNLGS